MARLSFIFARGRWLAGMAVLALSGLAPRAASAQIENQPPTDRMLAESRCVIGLERFLPGDYFFCLASQSYGRHEYRDARKFYLRAARWGSKPAEFVLGTMALYGDHQPVSRPLALAWYQLAAERHTERFEKTYLALRRSMSGSERWAAAAALERLGPAYRDAVAMPRAETRYRDGMHALHAEGFSDNICLEGTFQASGDASPATAAQIAGHCPTPVKLERSINEESVAVFEDWGGHVSIGPLQQVRNAPPPESGRDARDRR